MATVVRFPVETGPVMERWQCRPNPTEVLQGSLCVIALGNAVSKADHVREFGEQDLAPTGTPVAHLQGREASTFESIAAKTAVGVSTGAVWPLVADTRMAFGSHRLFSGAC